MSNQEFAQRWQGVMIDSYGTPGLSFVRGEGSTLWDADGTAYTDFVSGLAVNALGHAHPAVVGAVSRQIASLGHISNFYSAEPTITLAERLIELFGRPGRVFFCNSGAEANETAFKIGRLTGRSRIVAAQSGFHGRTMGSLALTGQPAKREPFLPLPGDVTHVPYGDAEALRAAVTEDTAMVILEPIQGESGVVVPPKGYLRAAREITEATGTLLVLDEVQTGIGRTGHWFAAQAEGVEADVVTLAKGLGGGLPLGAAVAFGRAAELMTPGHHASTFGGNPVSCARTRVLDTIAADGLLDRVKQLGSAPDEWSVRDAAAIRWSPMSGAGLMLGIVLNEPLAPQVQLAAQKAGFLVNVPAPDVVRLIPPLVIEETEVDAFLQALPGLLDAVHERDREGQTGE
uniref:Acetylornithine aminotransferase n=1 Tax=Streptomyces clavuligerus TaxID=1901 RepID=ARGD_STRCL|nr:RecName: Full=Acetylornithine aminotransferase; Short=ACOAT [Streptomyces clavuligerus]CAB82482.1 acetylornithine aminotransferase [Streptomyces clavuligerus]